MDPLHRELEDIKALIANLQKRVASLEARLGAPRGAASTSAETVTKPTPSAASPAALSTSPTSSAPAAPSSVPAARARQEGWEARIGRYWLNRIGIASLVLGVTFFLLYSVKYMGPAAKIAVGLASAIALIVFGSFMEYREGKAKGGAAELAWYWRGLVGGGWALFYFTVYAMHHIPSVRILSDVRIDFCLLAIVAAAAVSHSLRYRSETITALALLLGFVTTALGDVTYFTLASTLLLLGSLAWIILRTGWTRLYLYAVTATYVSHIGWIYGQIDRSFIVTHFFRNVQEAAFWLHAGFLGLYWLTFHTLLFALGKHGDKPYARARLASATLINGTGLVVPMLSVMDRAHPEFRFPFLFGAGAVYLCGEWLPASPALAAVFQIQTLMGSALIALSVLVKATDRWLSFWWLGQAAIALWVGLRHRRRAYRAFACGLSAVIFARLLTVDLWNGARVPFFGHSIEWGLFIGCVAAAVFLFAAVAYRLPIFEPVLERGERGLFYAYLFASYVVVAVLIDRQVPRTWQYPAFAAEAAMVTLLGLRLKDRPLRITGSFLFAATALLFFDIQQRFMWPQAAVVAMTFGLNRAFRRVEVLPGRIESVVRPGLAVLAGFLLTLLLWRHVDWQFISVAWALEGFTLLGFGFVRREKIWRVCGLGVFGVLIWKILFRDLAGADTIYRILSFIVAGLILLAASFAYGRFHRADTGGPDNLPRD